MTSCDTLTSNNCNQAFAITGNEFHIAAEEFWPTLLCRIVLIQPQGSQGFWAWMDCLRSCHSIFKSGLWLGHPKTLILFSLSHSEVDLPVSFVLLHKGHKLMAGHSTSGFSVIWCETSLCVLFLWSAVAFSLELSHGCRFCTVSFLLLNH